MINSSVQERVDAWLNGPYDKESKKKIRALQKSNPDALIDLFYTDLSFGTGGLRALMGIGPNRINVYTIARATQGLANYIKNQGVKEPSVFVGFDSRHNSQRFAEKTAEVLLASGIRVYLTKTLRPTPYISFGTRHYNCTAGVMITASHNPADYNGYKVYWSDGGQIVPPHDTGIIEEIYKVIDSQVNCSTLADPLLTYVDKELDEAYLNMVVGLQHFSKQNRERGKELLISYTSLHGTGITLVPEALKRCGFTSINFVEKQIIPDPDFPTLSFPNPEYPEALKLGIEQLEKSHSDLLIATDPDADRLGLVVTHHGRSVRLTGNEMAAICVDFLCKQKLPKNGAFVTTIVSTELVRTIAEAHKMHCFETLTGFKYIAEKILEWEESKAYQFIFGAEESYGCLSTTEVRDKDAVSASCLIAEIALDALLNKQTLLDKLEAIYKTYGVFREGQLSINFEAGKKGSDQIRAVMKKLRSQMPTTFSGQKVVLIEDYLSGTRYILQTNKEERLTLSLSDVLLLRLADGSKVVIRPSGTEPKVKIYASVRSRTESTEACDTRLNNLLVAAKQELQ